MFGIDPYSFETLWPSVLGVGMMVLAMTWGIFKVSSLVKRDAAKQ